MATTFPTVLNNVATTLGAAYVSGPSLTLASGYGATITAKLAAESQPSLSGSNWLRVTVDNGTAQAVFQATGLSGDVLTVALIEGAVPGGGFAVGASVQGRWTSESIREIEAAINTLEGSGVTVIDDLSDVTITAPDADEVLTYHSGSGTWINSGDLVSSVAANANDIFNLQSSASTLGDDLVSHTENTSNPHSTTYTQVGAAAASHSHAAGDITSGTLGVARGGTGATTFTSGSVLVGSGTGAIAVSGITYVASIARITGQVISGGETPSLTDSRTAAVIGQVGIMSSYPYVGFNAYIGGSPVDWVRVTSGFASAYGADSSGNLGFFTASTAAAGTSIAFTKRIEIKQTGSIALGAQTALATTASNGFVYVPTCAGPPTGAPTTISGLSPIVVDSTNNKLYFYSGGSWRNAGP